MYHRVGQLRARETRPCTLCYPWFVQSKSLANSLGHPWRGKGEEVMAYCWQCIEVWMAFINGNSVLVLT